VIGARPSGSSSHVTYAPVFQFTASDGRGYTVGSDVYGKESEVRYGERVQVLYWPGHPEAARLDAFAALWTMPLVAGVVGSGFSVVPGIVLVAWMRRRGSDAAADRVTRGFRRALGVLLIGGGSALLAVGLGFLPVDTSVNGARILAAIVGVLLAAAGVQVGQWVAIGSRLSDVFGSLVVTSMAAMFGWVAIYGNAADFHSTMSAGGATVTVSGGATPARIAFGAASFLAGLASLWAWKRVFRVRQQIPEG
jgi:hypothetical protein